MVKPRVFSVNIDKVRGKNPDREPDLITIEEPLEIRIGYGPENDRSQKSIAVTMRTPGNDFELSLGFLFTENIIRSKEQVRKIQYCLGTEKQESEENIVRVELEPEVEIDFSKLERNFYATSSCGICGKASIETVKINALTKFISEKDQRIPVSTLYQLPMKLRKGQSVFEHTGGIHATGLFDQKGSLQFLKEDVGRHNAMDKVIGAALFENLVPLNNSIAVVSGRASFELVQKSIMGGIPLMASVGAPSSLAVELAEEFNMTLIGFMREDRLNIYTGKDRIDFN